MRGLGVVMWGVVLAAGAATIAVVALSGPLLLVWRPRRVLYQAADYFDSDDPGVDVDDAWDPAHGTALS